MKMQLADSVVPLPLEDWSSVESLNSVNRSAELLSDSLESKRKTTSVFG